MSAAPSRDAGPPWALIPVKAFSQAKSRLAPALGPRERALFARSLFEHVLGALAPCAELGGVLVVTACPEVAAVARAHGAEVATDAVPEGLGLIVDGGLAALAARGAGSALVLMSDLPRLETAEIRRLLDLLRSNDLVLSPDERDEGTNALGLSPVDRIETLFGRADSFARHCQRAKDLGLTPAILRSPGLGFDIDGPDDLARLGAPGRSAALGAEPGSRPAA
ncbi:MAG: 2-phospho-L-lactate guanylyltransferase [Byssovorax sp.]